MILKRSTFWKIVPMKQPHTTGKCELDEDTAMTGNNSNVSGSQDNHETIFL
jgi:hypothetical protein